MWNRHKIIDMIIYLINTNFCIVIFIRSHWKNSREDENCPLLPGRDKSGVGHSVTSQGEWERKALGITFKYLLVIKSNIKRLVNTNFSIDCIRNRPKYRLSSEVSYIVIFALKRLQNRQDLLLIIKTLLSGWDQRTVWKTTFLKSGLQQTKR